MHQVGIVVVFFLNWFVYLKVYLDRFEVVAENTVLISTIFSILILVILVTSFLTAKADPEDQHVKDMVRFREEGIWVKDNDNLEYYCNICESNVSGTTKHCRQCNKCVSHFDHHCKWVNNCIGDANYRPLLSLWSSFKS